jgi:hypothetical protein
MSITHKVGDLVMGVNVDNETILGVIKKISIADTNIVVDNNVERYYEGEPHYQIEWANDLHSNVWYKESNVNAFKMTFDEYMRRKKK